MRENIVFGQSVGGVHMKHLFERTSSNWVRYSEYEWKTAENGTLYLTPIKTAQPGIMIRWQSIRKLCWMPST